MEEMPGEVQSSTQFAFEAGKWQAKYETLKEALIYERKKRNEVENDLRKLAFELGGVKNEVKQLEEKVRLLIGGQTAKAEPRTEAKTEEKIESQRQPVAVAAVQQESAPTEPKIEIPSIKTAKEVVVEFAKTTQLPTREAQAPAPKTAEVVAQAIVEKTEPPKLYIIKEELETEPVTAEPEKALPADESQDDTIRLAIANNYQTESGKMWMMGEILLKNLQRSPSELYFDIISNQEIRGTIYHNFIDEFEKIKIDYNTYRGSFSDINQDMHNLDKVIPYINNTLSRMGQEA